MRGLVDGVVVDISRFRETIEVLFLGMISVGWLFGCLWGLVIKSWFWNGSKSFWGLGSG